MVIYDELLAATVTPHGPHFLEIRGRFLSALKAVIHSLVTKTFLTDWCDPNPKKRKALCDLLVVFDDTAKPQ